MVLRVALVITVPAWPPPPPIDCSSTAGLASPLVSTVRLSLRPWLKLTRPPFPPLPPSLPMVVVMDEA